MAPIKISLSIYLLKTTALIEVQNLFTGRNATQLINGLDGQFIDFPSPSNPPNWFRAVSNHLASPGAFNIRGQSTAGMILIPRKTRHFAISFGHAWQYLKSPWLEPDFGRTVALGTVPPDQVIEVNSEQVFAKFHVAKERAPRATSYREFGIDSERDLVGAVEGMASDTAFGTVIRGATSLRVNIPINTIGTVLDKSLKLFSNPTYRTKYPSIDNLLPVSDDTVNTSLDNLLDADLKSGQAKKDAVLIAPSFRRGDAISADSFAFGRRLGNPALAPYLSFGSWEYYLQKNKSTPTLDLAKATSVHMFDAAGEIFESRKVYECLGYEVSLNGKPHILSSGVWYAADATFTAEIDTLLRAISAPALALPAWDGKQREDDYNNRCCMKGSGRLLMDKKIVHYGGAQSKFEFCDFMDIKNRILFFAKHPSTSAACSHFVEQVNRTIDLLFSSDGTFRSKLKKTIIKNHVSAPLAWLDQRPRPGEWQMCLVALGRIKEKLPLFAKCSVAKLSRDLDRAGHRLMYIAV